MLSGIYGQFDLRFNSNRNDRFDWYLIQMQMADSQVPTISCNYAINMQAQLQYNAKQYFTIFDTQNIYKTILPRANN